MAEAQVDRRFIFNGSAVAFGGRIRRPDDLFLKAVGVAHLPVTGGLSHSVSKGVDLSDSHYKEYLKFSEASSKAQGDFTDIRKAAEYTHSNHGQNPSPAQTSVESQLLDLCIDAAADKEAKTPRRTFRAKRLEVRMQTTSGRSAQQSAIHSLSAAFEEITITSDRGVAIPLKVLTATEIFSENTTKAKLIERYATDAEFRKKYASCFDPLGVNDKGFIGNLVSKHHIPYADRGPIVATFVTGFELSAGAPQGIQIESNRLTVPGLGSIYFGEIVIDDHHQRATLLRFELGSNVGGSTSACEASSNGTWYPPLS